MKHNDWALVIAVVFISGLLSLVLSKQIITSPKNRSAKVLVVKRINPEFPPPPDKYFNVNAFDPTEVIGIGGSTNPQPFR